MKSYALLALVAYLTSTTDALRLESSSEAGNKVKMSPDMTNDSVTMTASDTVNMFL